jgi:two-component system, LytTR family, response regulator
MLGLKCKNIIHLVDLNDIIFCQSKGNYTLFVIKDKNILVYQSLTETESLLFNQDDSFFSRCHYSYIVNIHKVALLDIKENVLNLINGMKIPVSRSKIKALKEAIEKLKPMNPP